MREMRRRTKRSIRNGGDNMKVHELVKQIKELEEKVKDISSAIEELDDAYPIAESLLQDNLDSVVETLNHLMNADIDYVRTPIRLEDRIIPTNPVAPKIRSQVDNRILSSDSEDDADFIF